jgi:hypothetical protein
LESGKVWRWTMDLEKVFLALANSKTLSDKSIFFITPDCCRVQLTNQRNMLNQGFFGNFCVITAQGIESIRSFSVPKIFKNDYAIFFISTVK